MNILEQYWQDAKNVISQPGEFFSSREDTEGYTNAILFAIISAVIASVLTTTLNLVTGTTSPLLQQANISILQLYLIAIGTGVIIAPIGAFIVAGLYHLILLFFGAQGYAKTFQIAAYTSAVNAFFGWIPYLNLLAWLYGLYVVYKGLIEMHGLSQGKSIATIILTFVLTVVIVIVVVIALLASGAWTPAPYPPGTAGY